MHKLWFSWNSDWKQNLIQLKNLLNFENNLNSCLGFIFVHRYMRPQMSFLNALLTKFQTNYICNDLQWKEWEQTLLEHNLGLHLHRNRTNKVFSTMHFGYKDHSGVGKLSLINGWLAYAADWNLLQSVLLLPFSHFIYERKYYTHKYLIRNIDHCNTLNGKCKIVIKILIICRNTTAH